MAVFVPGAAVGDTLQVELSRPRKTKPPLEKSKSLSFRQKTGSYPTVLAFPSAADKLPPHSYKAELEAKQPQGKRTRFSGSAALTASRSSGDWRQKSTDIEIRLSCR